MCYHNSKCRFNLWAPENHEDIYNQAFTAYTGSFELAARALAKRPEAQYNADLQDAICRQYGVFLDNITDDEATILAKMVEEYAGRY